MSQTQALSREQEQAAFFFDAPVCILAGAGSGKTRVITHRIAHLVKDKDALPFNILGVTFTNKAAREMRERVERLLPQCGREILLGTFHGLSARFLRTYGELVGIKKDFLIYDEDDASRLIKKIIQEYYDLDKDEIANLTKKVLRSRDVNLSEVTVGKERLNQILEAYQENLQKIGALDFSGLLTKFYELLDHEQGNRLICDRVRHLVVDEYQDINDIQAKIVHKLVNKANSAAIVGDDDQSIFGWRGASAFYMQYFLDAEKAQLFRLEDNYRSTKPILDCANAVISQNKTRLGKNLRSITGDGPLIRVSRHFRDIQEAGFVIENSLRLFEQHGTNFEIAVLMRTNAQTRPLEEALHKARMPYRIVGGMRFYDRKEIKDILAALRVVLHQHSDVDFMRVLHALPLGIGKKTQEILSSYAGQNKFSFFEALNNDEHPLQNSRAKKKIDELLQLMEEVRKEIISYLPGGEVKILRADEALIHVIDRFGFAKKLEEKNDEEALARLENIEQLVQAAASFVEEAENFGDPADAQSFLETVALISKDESVNDENRLKVGTITLMTLHAAKGLEFDAVFLVGLEEGVLPHTRSLGFDKEKDAIEEERRLFYVGITRAKKRLFLSFCQERFLHGKTTSSLPSQFLQEIPKETVDIKDRWLFDYFSPRASFKQASDFLSVKLRPSQKPASHVVENKNSDGYQVIYDAEEVFNDTSQKAFNLGAKVFHATYHDGLVLSTSGSGRMMRVKVKFEEDNQVRTIMATHLRSC